MTQISNRKLAEELKQLESILERAAGALGDIHPLILRHCFSQYPEARLVFTEHGGAYPEAMQNAMVDWSVYCMLCWLENPGEAKGVLKDAALQHKSNDIDPTLTRGLMISLFAVLGDTIPEQNTAEKRLWQRISDEITGFLIDAETAIAEQFEQDITA